MTKPAPTQSNAPLQPMPHKPRPAPVRFTDWASI